MSLSTQSVSLSIADARSAIPSALTKISEEKGKILEIAYDVITKTVASNGAKSDSSSSSNTKYRGTPEINVKVIEVVQKLLVSFYEKTQVTGSEISGNFTVKGLLSDNTPFTYTCAFKNG